MHHINTVRYTRDKTSEELYRVSHTLIRQILLHFFLRVQRARLGSRKYRPTCHGNEFHKNSHQIITARTARQTKKVMGKIGDMMILQIVAII